MVGFSIICWIKWKKISLDTPIIFAYNSSSAVAEEEVVAAAAVEQELVNRYTWIRFSRWLLCAIDYTHRRFKSVDIAATLLLFKEWISDFFPPFPSVYSNVIWMKLSICTMDISWSWPRFAESLRPEGGRTHGLKHMYSNFDCSGEFTHVSSFSLESRWKSALLAFYSLVHIINISTFGVNNNNHRINSVAVCVHPTQQHLLCTYCFDVFSLLLRLLGVCALFVSLFVC